MKPGDMALRELAALQADLTAELRRRRVIRRARSPADDLAAHAFCAAFGWTRAATRNPRFDATGPDGVRYQIRGRRLMRRNGSRALAPIRNLAGRHFHVLAAILFDRDFRVLRAALVPFDVVAEHATVSARGSARLRLSDEIFRLPDVRDSTEELRAVLG